MRSTNGVLFWDVRFIRSVHARDLEAMSDFMVTIYGSHIRGRGEDKMCWIPSKVKGFLVSDYYRILAGTAFFGFPWKSIWKQKIPSRVAFFVWTAALGKCLTIDNLRKRKGRMILAHLCDEPKGLKTNMCMSLLYLPFAIANALTARLNDGVPLVDERLVLLLYCAFSVVLYLHFATSVVHEITTALGIYCFRITRKEA
uniref:Reverse transcriptase zinc-binding domain-containing protein n=1 Tax=Quercus lobata TaxID=97700 RepID=A0A7N2L766_QUELO